MLLVTINLFLSFEGDLFLEKLVSVYYKSKKHLLTRKTALSLDQSVCTICVTYRLNNGIIETFQGERDLFV